MRQGNVMVPFNRPFPVFPLRDIVVFPHTLKPFFFYETRYQHMIRDVLDGLGLIVSARFRASPTQDEYLWGCPELMPVASLCQILDYEKTTEGYYNVMLYGLCRVKINGELRHNDYRTAYVRPFAPSANAGQPIAVYRKIIDGLLQRFLECLGKSAYPVIDHRLPTEILIDQLIDVVCPGTEQRYAMLRERDIHRRAAWLIRCLRETVDHG